MKAQWAATIALVTAIVVATAIYRMPVDQAALSAAEGATFGLFPIMWTVIAAIWVYNMTVETGHFAVLRRSIASVSEDQRIQAVMIAFCLGTLMEALAGFGAPAAITAVMLVALGFKPIKAAALALVGNTAAVPFGAIGIPIATLSEVTGLDEGELGAMVGRQTPLLGLIIPFVILAMVDGRRGIRQAWPVAAVGGVAFALAQFTCSNHISIELTDIVASTSSIAAIVALLSAWKPPEPLVAEPAYLDDASKDSPLDILRAYAPYLIIVAVFSLAQLPAVKRELAVEPWTASFQWPGLDIRNPDGDTLRSLTFQFNWLPAAGTLMLISGLATMAVTGLAPARALGVARATLVQLRAAILVVTAVLALAYVVNQSGQTLNARDLGGGRRLPFRVPRAGGRLAGRRRHRLGHLVERAFRWRAGGRRERHRDLSDAARRGKRLGWRPREDDLGSASGYRGRGRRHSGARGRAIPRGRGLEHRAAGRCLRARLPAIDVDAGVDGGEVNVGSARRLPACLGRK